MASFAMKRPYRFTALTVVGVIVVYLASGTVAAVSKLPTIILYLIANLVLVTLAAVLLTRLHLWKAVGFRALAAPRDLRLYWLPFIAVLVNLAFGIAHMSVGRVAFYALLAGLVGFVEEVFFRGLILRAIAPQGLWKAAIISSILFGLVHSLNVLAGANPLYTLLQVGYALAIGFGFAAVTLRTGAIWPLVIIHALIDFTSFLASNGISASSVTTIAMVLSAIYIVAFTVYGVFMMQASGRPRTLGGTAGASAGEASGRVVVATAR